MCLVYTLNSAKQVLLPNLDCSLEGLPRSTFYISIKATSLWHFQINLTLSDDLGYFIAVKLMP